MDRFSHELGVTVQTAYGLTETYGPISTHIPYNHSTYSDGEWVSFLSIDKTLTIILLLVLLLL